MASCKMVVLEKTNCVQICVLTECVEIQCAIVYIVYIKKMKI